METCVIGIDPGASGGIAVTFADGRVNAVPMPDTQGDILQHLEAAYHNNAVPCQFRCYMEIIPPFMGTDIPQSRVAVMFENFGYVKGVIQGLKIPLYMVRPQVWMQTLGIGGVSRQRAPKGATADQKKEIGRLNAQAKREWKNKLKAEAQRRYPTLKITLDKADAILIMDYGLRQQNIERPTLAPSPTNPSALNLI